MRFLKRFLAGMGIGTGAAIPGVSGAAIAVIFGVYEDIIGAVNNFRKKFGYAILVLLPILLGIICAVIPCIILFSWAFEHLLFILICIFAGFLLGSFPSILDKVKGVTPNRKHVCLIIAGALFVIVLGILSIALGDKFPIANLFRDINDYWWLYLVLIPVGVAAAVALTVPGLSGSLILLVIGFYRPLVDYVKFWGGECLHGNWEFIGPLLGVIGCFGLGCLIGVVLVSKIMIFLLKKYHDATFFAIIGFIGGSIIALFFNYDIFNYYLNWAGQQVVNTNPVLPIYFEIPIGIVVLLGCMVGSYFLIRLEKNKQTNAEENKEEKKQEQQQ